MATIEFTDGTTTVPISGLQRGDFHINAPESGAAAVSQMLEYVTFSGSAARTIINTLNLLFEKARQRTLKGVGVRVFCKVKVDEAESYYRTEVFDGIARADTEALGDYAQASYVRCPITWIHAPWWEGDWVQLTIANIHGSTSTSYLTVDGYTAAAKSSYFVTTGSGVLGDMPSKAQLEITNSGVVSVQDVVIGLFRGSTSYLNSSTLYSYLEGEASSSSVGGSTVADVNSSGGFFKRVVWSGSSQLVIGWAISANLLNLTDGKPLVPVVRFASFPPANDIYIRFRLYYGSSPVDETPWQSLTNLSSFHVGLPLRFPAQSLAGNHSAHTLYMEAQRVSAVSTTLDIDFVQLFPTDTFERLVSISGVFAAGNIMVVDEVEDLLYTLVGGVKVGNFARTTNRRFDLNPQEQATFTLLARQDTGGNTITQSFGIKLYVRPRRKSI